MTDLPPYTGNYMDYCVKCGHTEADTEYASDTVVDIAGRPIGPIDDALTRTCNRCGYRWREATLDSRRKEA